MTERLRKKCVIIINEVILVKLLMIIAGDECAEEITSKLVDNHYSATNIGSSGDFLQYGYEVSMLGIEDEQLNDVYELLGVHEHMDPKHLPYHGEVSIYIIDVNKHAKMKKPME